MCKTDHDSQEMRPGNLLEPLAIESPCKGMHGLFHLICIHPMDDCNKIYVQGGILRLVQGGKILILIMSKGETITNYGIQWNTLPL